MPRRRDLARPANEARGIVIALRLLEALTAGEAELRKALLMDAVSVGKECQGGKWAALAVYQAA